MRRFIEKLKSKKGETLVEILIAIFVLALSAGMFAAMYAASTNIDAAARAQDEDLYSAVSELEKDLNVGGGSGKDGTLLYTPVGEGATGSPSKATVTVYEENGMVSYYGEGGYASSGTGGSGGGSAPAEGGNA